MPNPMLAARKFVRAIAVMLALVGGGVSGRAETVRIPRTNNPALQVEVPPGWTLTYQGLYSGSISPGNGTPPFILSMILRPTAGGKSLPEIAAELIKGHGGTPFKAMGVGSIAGKSGMAFISQEASTADGKTQSRLVLVQLDDVHYAALLTPLQPPLTPPQAKDLATVLEQVRFIGLEAGDALAKGYEAYLEHDYDSALASYEEAIRLDPHYAEAFLFRGMVSQDRKDFDHALADFGQAISLNPNLPWPHMFSGLIYLKKKDFAKAMTECNEAVRVDPESPAAINSRGLVYSAQGDFARATADFNAALRIDPACFGAFVGRAEVYLKQGDFAHAITDYEEFIRLHPANSADYCNLVAWLYATAADEKIRDGAKAVELATKSCELTGWKEPNYLEALAAAYAEVGKFDEAVKWQSQFLATRSGKEPADEAHARLELYQQRKPYHQPAETDPRIAGIRLTEGNEAAAVAKGKAANSSRNFDLAITAFDEAIRLDPRDANAFSGRGFAYYSKNDFERALVDCNQAIALDPSWVAPHTLRGRIRARQHDYPNAIVDFNDALRLKPGLPWILAARGDVYVDQQDFVRGMADYDTAIRLDPNYFFAYTRRARAYLLQDNVARAVADYDHVLRLNPTDPGTYNNLAWLRATTAIDEFRDGVKAVELATKACELSEWKNPTYVDTLAAACAEAGKFDDAVKWEMQYLAGKLSKDDGDRARARLSLYQQKKPYREPRKSLSPAVPEKAAR